MLLTLIRIAETKIHMPWNNLGCLGLHVPGRFYVDVFRRGGWGPWYRFGVFVCNYQRRTKTWYTWDPVEHGPLRLVVAKKEPRHG